MSAIELTDGSPVPADGSHTRDRGDGQQVGYVVLSAEERAKGFVKPLRRSYRHVGPPAPEGLRDLTDEERARNDPAWGYVKFEEYGPERSPLVGKYWTQPELDRIERRCNAVTTMGRSLCETYARDPHFYSGTFCCACGAHFPLNEFQWEDGEPMDPALQPAWAEKQALDREERRQRRIAQLKHELAELENDPSAHT